MTPAGTPADYRYVAFFIALGIAFIAITLLMSALVRRRGRKSEEAVKLSAYECGEEPVGEAWMQAHIGYYLIALLFVVFDIDTVFVAPWALVLKHLPSGLMLTGFVEGLVFIAILAVGLVYAYRRGVLKWI